MAGLYKIAVTVPENDADALREAIAAAGGGKVGNYTHCSFSVKGTGRFKPGVNANPAIGSIGNLEVVAEERIEVNCDEGSLDDVLDAIRDAHPYEEPAIDLYRLEALPPERFFE